jgi:hypothetical protein
MFSFYVRLRYRALYYFALKRKEELKTFRSKQIRKNVILREEFLSIYQNSTCYEAIFGGDCGLRRKKQPL